jgi:hypothetical protein
MFLSPARGRGGRKEDKKKRKKCRFGDGSNVDEVTG